jgi:hypothetical protein
MKEDKHLSSNDYSKLFIHQQNIIQVFHSHNIGRSANDAYNNWLKVNYKH